MADAGELDREALAASEVDGDGPARLIDGDVGDIERAQVEDVVPAAAVDDEVVAV